MYDVIIIGKGPAGISASLYSSRAKLNTLIIGTNESSLKKSEKIDNYFGFSEGISGTNLLKEGESQALRLGVEIVEDEVINIEKKDYFEITTTTNKYVSKSVLLATGQPQKKLRIENLESYEGRGISYCSTCDGFFYNNLRVGVLGSKDFALHEAKELEAFTKDITILTNGLEPDVSEKSLKEIDKFKIIKETILRFEGKDFLDKVIFTDGSSLEIDGIFVANETASSIDFARKLGIIVDGNSIIIDKNQQTNLDGLFAAGDCTGGFKQIATAVGQGAIAGRKMIEYVKSL